MKKTAKLRPATREDIPKLEEWDTLPHIIRAITDDPEQTTAFADIDWEAEVLNDDPACAYYIAEVDGRPIGAMQIIDPALERTHYWGDHPAHHRALDIWIGEKDALNHGYGTQMMQQALDIAFQPADVVAIVIDPLASNTNAHRFYRRLGFRFVEQRQFDDDICFVFKLSRADWQGTKP